MKVALFGSNGSIGKRYAAILNHLDVPFKPVEIDSDFWRSSNPWENITHAIVATPTHSHLTIARAASNSVPTLCEKPLTDKKTELDDWKALKSKHPIYMVNNYSFLDTNPGFPPRVDRIEYNFYNTGKDGTALDCIQLLYMAQKIGAEIEIKKVSPVWDLWINDKLKVPYEWIEWSYVQMLNAFVHNMTSRLWPISYAIEATELAINVQEKMENPHAHIARNPSPVK